MDFLNFSEVADEWNTTYTNSSSVTVDTEYSLLSITGLAVVVGFLILFTIVGNVLVVIAVLTSRALKPPQNLFLVSLASADILVATLVMPFSLANELMGYWFFGKVWCDIYLALDVLFCTSSIVHLCAISLDRYWSITQAIEYNQKRTPKRLKGMIVVVWLISAVISFPPLISMDRSSGGDISPQCRLNDETWYILYSSIGSFFAPCVIMILVYIRIYQVAKTRTRTMSEKKREVEDNGTAPLDVNGLEQGGEEGGRGSLKENGGGGGVARENGHCQRQQKTPVPPGLLPNEPKSTPNPDDADDFDDSSSSDEKPQKRPPSSSSSQHHHHHHHHHHQHDDKKDSKPSEIRKSTGSRKSSLASSKPSEIRKSTGSRKSSLASSKPSESRKSTGSRKSCSSSRSMEMFSSRRKRRSTVNRKTITAAREKRFTFVLAVVMGVFVVCWFPFFFSYSLYGVCRAPCEIPETLFKFFFWIGYVNSSLNPVIYTIFNQDFRRAFQKILVCKSGKRSF